MKKILFFLVAAAILLPNQLSSQTIPYSKGRIAISSDGNEHDKDDWAATPFTLALLASQGLQDKVTVYTFSDHVWGSNHDHSDALQQMRESALEGKNKFGFNSTNFIEAVSNKNQAYNAIRDEILASTAADPLTIIAAGPMQVVGEGISRAYNHASYTNQLNHVRIISHSNWNDRHSDNPNSWENHSGWTWAEIESNFKNKGLNCDHIVDQNGGNGYDGMRANKSKFSWLNTSPYRNHEAYQPGSWAWLYSRQEAAQKNQDFDPSDAGMVIYLLTGVERTDPSDAKQLMESPVGGGGDDIRDITDLSLNATNCSTIVLNWTDNSTGEDGFRVRRKVPGGTYAIIADVPAGTETYTDASAAESTEYIYMVRPMNNGAAAAISNTPSVTTDACGGGSQINDITDLSATTQNCSTVVLNWTDNSTGEDAFRVRRKVSGGTYVILADVPAGTETYTDATAAESTSYIYMVRPMDNGVAAGISNTPSVTTDACGTSGITIDITSVVTDCNASGKARNIIYFTVSGSTSAPTANKGTILNDGNGNYRLRETNVTFGSVTNYVITVESESVSQSVTAVSSCAKAADAIISNNAKVMVSPNPMMDYATIQLSGFENASLQLISLNGQVVVEMNDVNDLIDLQVSDIKAGVYMLRVMDANNTQVQQVVIK